MEKEGAYKIKFENFETIPIDFEDVNLPKIGEYNLKNEKDFQYLDEMNFKFKFNFDEKKLEKKNSQSSTTTLFNADLLPIKSHSLDEKYGLNIMITYEYNAHNDLILEKVKNEGSPILIKKFEYVYDSKNNWIERKEFENGKLIFTTKRQIVYE